MPLAEPPPRCGRRRAAVAALGAVLAAALAAPASAVAAYDSFADDRIAPHFRLVDPASGLSLVLKGELVLGLHDLEGEGGPGHDSPTDTRTIGTRSPFVELTALTLAPRIGIGDHLAACSAIDLGGPSPRVRDAWLDVHFDAHGLEQHGELGLRPPFVVRESRLGREPLAASTYWGHREMHLTWEVAQSFGPDGALRWEAGVSAAMGRPLGFAPVQASAAQRGTINVLAYKDASVFSGNAPVWGGRARLAAYGLYTEGFAFTGTLADEDGADVLTASFADYPAIEEPGEAHTSRWYGGRAGYKGHGAHAVVEAVRGAEGSLRRTVGDAQLGYKIPILEGPWLTTIEPMVRYDLERIDDSDVPRAGLSLRSPALSRAATWDWTVLTLGALAAVYRDILYLGAEYDHVTEANGVSVLGLPEVPFKNDELRIELSVRF